MMRVANQTVAIEDFIKQFEMDSFLNQELLNALELFDFPVYSSIFIEQDEQHYLYFLVEGQVQCSHYRTDGEPVVFAISKPFTAIGDFEIFTTRRVKSNVIAIQPAKMLGIARPIVERYGGDDSRFLRFLLDETRKKLYNSNQLQQNQTLPLINRLAVFILSNMMEEQTISLPDKEILASLLGATLRHLNRVLKKLKDTGAISETYPRIRVLDYALLQNLACP